MIFDIDGNIVERGAGHDSPHLPPLYHLRRDRRKQTLSDRCGEIFQCHAGRLPDAMWTTIRAAWPAEKEEYYRSHVGELVNIEV